jgi:hypothetical protein
MPNSPEDIIELTDIIEHGSGVPRQEGAADGVDLSFERELEDLFAESPPSKPAKTDSDLPGLDALRLPDEAAKEADDIDLDGLDVLLAEAEKGKSGGMDLPELADDFLHEPEIEGHPASAAGQGQDAAVNALALRLDAVESRLTGIRDDLTASFQAMLDEALTGLKDELSSAPATQAPIDPAPLIEQLRQSLEERIEAVAAAFPPAPAPVDEEALSARVKEEILSGLPTEPAPLGEEALEARVLTQLEERLDAFRTEISVAEPVSPAPVDAEALEAKVLTQLEERLDAFRAEISAASTAAPAPFDEEVLASRVKEEILSELPEPGESPALMDPAPLIAELSAELRGDLETLKAQVAAIPAPTDAASLLEDLAARLESRLSALESRDASHPAPGLDRLASKDDLDTLRRDILDEVRKIVPAAAARIIREEIQALVQEMD